MRTARVAPERRIHHPLAVAFSRGGLGEDQMTEKLSYAAQLRHPNWQKRRLERLSAAEWTCQNCGDKSTTLHVHHKRYVKGRLAWEYDDAELAVLCDPCHEEEHYIIDELRELLVHINSTTALALLRGFLANADWFDPWIGDAGRDRDPDTYAVGAIAHLLTFVPRERLREAAELVASLTPEQSEARMLVQFHNHPWTQLLGQ